jgi:hypothetical protein
VNQKYCLEMLTLMLTIDVVCLSRSAIRSFVERASRT